MVSVVPTYTENQIAAWLRGLLTIAWADGHYSPEEQVLIAEMTKDLAAHDEDIVFKSIGPEELAETLGKDERTAENFLRTAVMVAIADGIYSPPEAELLHQFSDALGLKGEALQSLEYTLCHWEDGQPAKSTAAATAIETHPHLEPLHALKDWLDGMEMHDPRIARFVCKMVPSQCPFERDVKLFGRKVIHIPPMCKLNPLYDQLVGLRFRALSYLADECGEDISEYI